MLQIIFHDLVASYLKLGGGTSFTEQSAPKALLFLILSISAVTLSRKDHFGKITFQKDLKKIFQRHFGKIASKMSRQNCSFLYHFLRLYHHLTHSQKTSFLRARFLPWKVWKLNVSIFSLQSKTRLLKIFFFQFHSARSLKI